MNKLLKLASYLQKKYSTSENEEEIPDSEPNKYYKLLDYYEDLVQNAEYLGPDDYDEIGYYIEEEGYLPDWLKERIEKKKSAYEKHNMTSLIGKTIYGFTDGTFGRDAFNDRVIEGIGKDWIVGRTENGELHFGRFNDTDELKDFVEKYSKNS